MSSYFLSEISQIMAVMTFLNNGNLVAMLTKVGPLAQIVENCKVVNIPAAARFWITVDGGKGYFHSPPHSSSIFALRISLFSFQAGPW
jgi:hypothetical protein